MAKGIISADAHDEMTRIWWKLVELPRHAGRHAAIHGNQCRAPAVW
jgi:hypothetical protein